LLQTAPFFKVVTLDATKALQYISANTPWRMAQALEIRKVQKVR
jgi:hypothetical protein